MKIADVVNNCIKYGKEEAVLNIVDESRNIIWSGKIKYIEMRLGRKFLQNEITDVQSLDNIVMIEIEG